MTHSGHSRFAIAVVQLDPGTPFRGSKFPAVINILGTVPNPGAGNATA